MGALHSLFLAVNPPDELELAQATAAAGAGSASQLPLVQRTGLLAVRGAEVVEVRDEEGGLMNDFTGRVRLDERKPPKGGWVDGDYAAAAVCERHALQLSVAFGVRKWV